VATGHEHFAGVELGAIGGLELVHLGVTALAVGRNPCVVLFHGDDSAPDFRTKTQSDQGHGFGAKILQTV
jgi:hypothetical protein